MARELQARFSNIRSRSHDTYSEVLAGKDNVPAALQAQVGILASDDKDLVSEMKELDAAIAGQFRSELGAIDLWSVRSA